MQAHINVMLSGNNASAQLCIGQNGRYHTNIFEITWPQSKDFRHHWLSRFLEPTATIIKARGFFLKNSQNKTYQNIQMTLMILEMQVF